MGISADGNRGNTIRILTVVQTPITGVEHYRALGPLHQMSLAGHEYSAISPVDFYNLVRGGYQVYKYFDILQFQRLLYDDGWRGFYDNILIYRGMGTSVIIDYDDDYTNTYRVVSDYRLDGLQDCSALFVSTPFLKQVMKPYNRNIIVVPNAVSPELFRNFKRVDPHLTIGLTGSPTHEKDWGILVPVLIRILEKYPDVRLLVAGMLPETLAGHPQVLTPKEVLGIPQMWLSFEQYLPLMRQVDISLCPIDPDDKFSWSKSNIKALESMSASRQVGPAKLGGAAVIVTGDVPNFRDCVLSGKTGLLVDHHNSKQWEEAITNLIENSSFRETLQVNGYDFCQKYFTLQARLAERVSAYRQVIALDSRQIQNVRARVAALVGTNP